MKNKMLVCVVVAAWLAGSSTATGDRTDKVYVHNKDATAYELKLACKGGDTTRKIAASGTASIEAPGRWPCRLSLVGTKETVTVRTGGDHAKIKDGKLSIPKGH